MDVSTFYRAENFNWIWLFSWANISLNFWHIQFEKWAKYYSIRFRFWQQISKYMLASNDSPIRLHNNMRTSKWYISLITRWMHSNGIVDYALAFNEFGLESFVRFTTQYLPWCVYYYDTHTFILCTSLFIQRFNKRIHSSLILSMCLFNKRFEQIKANTFPV